MPNEPGHGTPHLPTHTVLDATGLFSTSFGINPTELLEFRS
jgi:hypothetical protein